MFKVLLIFQVFLKCAMLTCASLVFLFLASDFALVSLLLKLFCRFAHSRGLDYAIDHQILFSFEYQMTEYLSEFLLLLFIYLKKKITLTASVICDGLWRSRWFSSVYSFPFSVTNIEIIILKSNSNI